MKKTLSTIMAATVAASLLTSCLDKGENTLMGFGYFTVENNGSTVILHQDGGGTVYPSSSSVSDLTQGKGMKDIERASFTYQYTEGNISQDGNSITDVKLITGETIPVEMPMTLQDAQAKNVMSEDSLNNISKVYQAWAYKGYLTLSIRGSYIYNSEKKSYLWPTMNLVYDPKETIPNELHLRFCYNKRVTKNEANAGERDFILSYRLQPFAMDPTVKDSVKLVITFDGIAKPTEFKVARNDFWTKR